MRNVGLIAVSLAVLGGCGGSGGDDSKPASKNEAVHTPASNPNPKTPKDCLADGERRSPRLWRGKWSGKLVRIHRLDSPAEAKSAARAADLVAGTSVRGYAVFAPRGGEPIARQVADCLKHVPYHPVKGHEAKRTAPAQPAQTQPSRPPPCPPGQLPMGPSGEEGCGPADGSPSVDSPEGQRQLRTDPDCQGLPPPPPSYHGPVQC
jgi:hypothetical protein